MSQAKTYRVAVVGGAGMWGRHYLRAYADNPRCQIIGLVDRAVERRRQFAAHYGIGEECQYDELEDLLAREVPDAVSAILPVQHTVDAVIACARAGVKAISCEKPIAVELSRADEAVRLCRQYGAALGCGTALWEVPFLGDVARWVAAGHIGELTGAAIPGGLPTEVSGAGCVQLTQLRLLSGRDVEWVEGWVLPPEEGWVGPPGAVPEEIDGPAYGRLGLEGGIVCRIPRPTSQSRVPCRVALTGTEGRVWANSPRPVLVRGTGPAAAPMYPEFLQQERPRRSMDSRVAGLVQALDEGLDEVPCSGHDYRQALEIALALKQSASQNHRRVYLPLEDRNRRIYPHPYRLQGGDVAGYESIGYAGPPAVERRPRRRGSP